MKPNSLQELYVEQLKDLYDAEHQIVKALPKMIDAATSSDLKAALNEHLEVTKAQVTRLGEENAGRLLQATLDEEKEADRKLTTLASEILAATTPVEHEKTPGKGKRAA